jgi:hypothetical protein
MTRVQACVLSTLEDPLCFLRHRFKIEISECVQPFG